MKSIKIIYFVIAGFLSAMSFAKEYGITEIVNNSNKVIAVFENPKRYLGDIPPMGAKIAFEQPVDIDQIRLHIRDDLNNPIRIPAIKDRGEFRLIINSYEPKKSAPASGLIPGLPYVTAEKIK